MVTAYEVIFMPPAEKQISKIGFSASARVLEKLRWLSVNFERVAPERLAAGLRDFLKLRVGDIRVVYTADRERKKIRVYYVGHRREIYKGL